MIVRDRGHRQQSSPVLKSEISWISTLQGFRQDSDIYSILPCVLVTLITEQPEVLHTVHTRS